MSIGGLYFGMMRDGALKVEDLELVTLLPKRDSFAADLHEILDFVKDDLNALVEGLILSSRYCYFPNHQFNFFLTWFQVFRSMVLTVTVISQCRQFSASLWGISRVSLRCTKPGHPMLMMLVPLHQIPQEVTL